MKLLLGALALTAMGTPAVAQTVSNPSNITVVDNGATLSVIHVAGISGTVTGLTLTLNGLSPTFPTRC
jgi:hypothetical protein